MKEYATHSFQVDEVSTLNNKNKRREKKTKVSNDGFENNKMKGFYQQLMCLPRDDWMVFSMNALALSLKFQCKQNKAKRKCK